MPKKQRRIHGGAALTGMLIAGFISCCGLIYAQDGTEPPPAESGLAPNDVVFHVMQPRSDLKIIERTSRIIELDVPIRVVMGFDESIVSVTAMPDQANAVRMQAEAPGITTLTLQTTDGKVYTIDVIVRGDTRQIEAMLSQLFPESHVEAVKMNEGILLRGWVTNPDHVNQIFEVISQYAPKERILNHLQVAGSSTVQLQVKVMEVQRTKVKQLGFNFVYAAERGYLASTPGALAPLASATLPFGGPASVVSNPVSFANSTVQFGLLGDNHMFNGFFEALQKEALLKILAEPVLITTSGRPAQLLSGGEFPVLVPQSLGTVTIQWREFGVRMEMLPIVLDNGRVRLDVAPEVSEKDFSSAVNVNGLLVPGITTRRVNTQVEMRFGETLMIGGLISTRKTADSQKIPLLGDIPIVGAAFSRRNFTNSETELVILVTPQLVAPISPIQVPAGGPGLNSDDPTLFEFGVDGMLEVPNYSAEGDGYADEVDASLNQYSVHANVVPYGSNGQQMAVPQGDPVYAPSNGMQPEMMAPPSDPGLQPTTSVQRRNRALGIVSRTNKPKSPEKSRSAVQQASGERPAGGSKRKSQVRNAYEERPALSGVKPGLIGPDNR